MTAQLKFPYGISDFRKLMLEDYFYVDRSAGIRLIEDTGPQLLFLRPRRFGKSLLLSLLENYYDVARAGEFTRLFGRLAIGQNPTPLHNQYLVLKWDFSVVAAEGQAGVVRQALHDHLNARMTTFADAYQAWLPRPVVINPTNAIATFESLLNAVQQSGLRLYLLIDEYDNFANEVLMASHAADQERYAALLHGQGAIKTLFKAIKSASAGQGLDRVFITGVSPVVLSDLTSGRNVAENVYLKPAFNDLCGFKEAEIAAALSQVAAVCGYSAEKSSEALDMMRTFYNGYRFSPDASAAVYNPTLALYFLKEFQETCGFPRNLLDSNLAMDRSKIAYVTHLPGGAQLILDLLTDDAALTVRQLVDRFGVEEMRTTAKDHSFMASLLYYFGVLTHGGLTPLQEIILRTPNLVTQRLYVERAAEMLLPALDDQVAAQEAVRLLLQTGDLEPLCTFVESRYLRVFSNRDDRWANELTIKTAFLTLLFNDTLYVMDSETAVGRRHADLTLIQRMDVRRPGLLDFVIEFKYVALPDAGVTAETARRLSAEQVRALPAVKAALAAAQAALPAYRQELIARYGAILDLRAYTIVALGFERLAWTALG